MNFVRVAAYHLLGMILFFFAIQYAAAETEYVFANIADTTQGFSKFGRPSLNDLGEIAVGVEYNTDLNGDGRIDFLDTGILAGKATGISTVIDASNPVYDRIYISTTFRNNVGEQSVLATVQNEDFGRIESQLLINPSGTVTTIASSADGFSFGGNAATLNNRGVAAFTASRPGNEGGVFTGNGDTLNTIANFNRDPIQGSSGRPDINDAGVVVFQSSFDNLGDNVIAMGSGGPPTITLDTSGQFNRFGSSPQINNAGTIAFEAKLDTGEAVIAKKADDSIKILAIAETGSFSVPKINDAGLVIFVRTIVGESSVLYVADELDRNSVLETGDPLFGSTVANVAANSIDINNRNDIVFRYILDDGRIGVAVATVVPLPATGGTILISLLCLSFTQLSRRRRLAA